MRRLDQVYHRAELRAAAYRGGEARKDLVGCGSRCGREHAVFQEPPVLAPVRRTRDVVPREDQERAHREREKDPGDKGCGFWAVFDVKTRRR